MLNELITSLKLLSLLCCVTHEIGGSQTIEKHK